MATLLPLLASLPQPLALLEVGASAGLCLFPDRYSYRYSTGEAARRIDPASGVSTVVLDCEISGRAPVPESMPTVTWRAGIDINPLDVRSSDDAEWLTALVWPGQPDRERALGAAIEIAAADAPRIECGDLNEVLPQLAAQAPADATLVVFHSAVLAYLSAADAERFSSTVRSLPGHWISNEGRDVTPGLVDAPTGPMSAADSSLFTVALDGQAVALAHPHGASLHWLQ